MPTARAGNLELVWNEETRVAVLLFDSHTDARGREARTLVEAFEGWLGPQPRAFALLSDGGRLRSVDAEYRAVWGDFFRAHRDRAFLAFYNMGALIRVAAEMFRIGTGVQLKAFPDEAAARAWLLTKGLRA